MIYSQAIGVGMYAEPSCMVREVSMPSRKSFQRMIFCEPTDMMGWRTTLRRSLSSEWMRHGRSSPLM